jgi:Ca-activated chloride channel homolog
VLCFGKWKGHTTGTVEVTGVSGSGAFHQTFQVGEARMAESDAALRNLWARHRIQRLADYAGLGAAQPKAITELGLKYGLLTEYTSFVAIDTEIRNAGGQQTTIKQPLPLPEGVSNLAVGGSASPLMCAPAPTPQTRAYPMKEKKLSKATRSEEISAPRTQQELIVDAAKGDSRALGAQTSPLASNPAVTPELRRLLQTSPISDLLKNVPAGTVLVLALDANGKILKAHFTKAFKGDAEALAMIQKWTVTDWKGGRQTLHQPLRIPLPFKG